MRIVIVRSRIETGSPRVMRNARVLASHGHDVTVLAWDRECKYPKIEDKDNCKIIRTKFKAPSGPKVLLFLPLWWCLVFFWLLRIKWDVIHAIELDTAFPALVAAKIKRKYIVYELNDIYADMIIIPKILRKIGLYLEKNITRFVNAVVIADEATIKELNGIPNRNIVLVCNSPPDFFKKMNSGAQREDIFTLFYAGELIKSKGLNLGGIVEAVKSVDDVRIIFAGFGDQVEEIKKWASETPEKVQFIGKINYTEVLERTMSADLLVAFHNPTIPINRVSIANKLYEAMICGKPIITVKGTATAEIVEKEKSGLIIDYPGVEELKAAIIKLKENPTLCIQLGTNGRKAYEQRYNWEIMEKRLLDMYDGMFQTLRDSGKNQFVENSEDKIKRK